MSHSIYNCQWQFAHAYELVHEFVLHVVCTLHETIAKQEKKNQIKQIPCECVYELSMVKWISNYYIQYSSISMLIIYYHNVHSTVLLFIN